MSLAYFHEAYRMRVHIAKSLQTRSRAIRHAVNTYNSAAVKLDPPRPTLDWTKVSHYTFLDEFNILRDTRDNIQDRPWANPAIRETMKKYQRVKRAREEIIRCNIEVRRLRTSIVDENVQFTNILARLKNENSRLLGPVGEYIHRRRGVNTLLLARILQIHELKGFTGEKTVGVRKGAETATEDSLTPAVSTETEDDGQEDADDEITGQIGGLVDYIAQLAV